MGTVCVRVCTCVTQSKEGGSFVPLHCTMSTGGTPPPREPALGFEDSGDSQRQTCQSVWVVFHFTPRTQSRELEQIEVSH